MPATGAKIHIVGAQFAVLAGHASVVGSGEVIVVDTTTMTQVGYDARGRRPAQLDRRRLRRLGLPRARHSDAHRRRVRPRARSSSTISRPDRHAAASPSLVLNDAQPENDQQFGRDVATMKFNNQQMLVVAAKSEMFSYYRTALYDALP